jgi:3-dehydroquinate synthase
MSEKFKIKFSGGSYDVVIQSNSTTNIIKEHSDLMVVDKKVDKLWENVQTNKSIKIEALETNKTLIKSVEVLNTLRELSATRGSVLLVIGGGVIQDISTLCASIYMRGIKWIYLPTTLLGMVDSCIGGKSSINIDKHKNLVGNFYPPTQVIVDTNFCKTLTEEQIVEGLFEAIKICYADSEEKLDNYLSLIDLNKSLHLFDFNKIVSLSLLTKKHFIEEDEFDNNIRLLLNFGHTFGHALESASSFEIRHGVAVGLGMLCAYNTSISLGLMSEQNTRGLKLVEHILSLLKSIPNLSSIISKIEMQEIMEYFEGDKKHTDKQFVLILFDKSGGLIRHKLDKSIKNRKTLVNIFEGLRSINEI